MLQIGYWLSREEHAPNHLVRHAQAAEAAGFTFALISDNGHPWVDHPPPPHCPFMWNVIGGIAYATQALRLGTILTRSTRTLNPAIIVEAAATAGAMMPGRFFLGVGLSNTGHPSIPPSRWPGNEIRRESQREMLAEVIEVIRLSWHGASSQRAPAPEAGGPFYRLPEALPPLFVAADGLQAAELAGRLGDGLFVANPTLDLVKSFERAGGAGKPRYGKLTVCWARNEAEATYTAERIWPRAHLSGSPYRLICGPDPRCCLEEIRRFAELGFDHISLHQLGPDQDGFFRFCEQELLPRVATLGLPEQYERLPV